MNVRPPIEASNPTAVLSVAFNNDSSCFAVGLESGICSMFHGIFGHCICANLLSLSHKVMFIKSIKRYSFQVIHTISMRLANVP